MYFFKIITATILLIIFNISTAANLSATTDRFRIGEDETLTLTITYDDASISNQPNLGKLESSFEIINSGSSSETRIINGSINSTKRWRYTLMPKKLGKTLIPSFSIGDSYSEPIEIEVVDKATLRTIQNGNRGDLFIDAALNKREAYIQEMITLTIRIYTSVQIAQPKLPELTLPGFMVEKIGEAQFETRESDRNYYVLEYRYALFAHQSGDFTIPKQRYQIAQIISNGSRSIFNIPGLDTQTQARFLSTDDIPIRIHAAPTHTPVDYWLVSEDVTLTDDWETEQSIELGTPITRSIEIKALGNLAANIPPLQENTPINLKIYREQPILTNSRVGENLLATRTENMAIVAIEPGLYTLPEIRLHWWSNKEKQFKLSTLPERHIKVSGAPAHALTPFPVTASPGNALVEDANKPPIIQSSNVPFYLNAYLWMGISAGLCIVLLVTLSLFFIKPGPKKPASIIATKQKSAKNSLQELKYFCQTHDANQTRSKMIDWAKKQWPNDSLVTFNDVKTKINHPKFFILSNELDYALYKKETLWNGNPMLEFLNSDEFLSNVLIKSKKDGLPGLYD